jgi:N-acetylglucosaminyldiphosphoundecaprenol N-acetyl-beta-D-mannosaminyltransferase
MSGVAGAAGIERFDLFGVRVSAMSMRQAVAAIDAWIAGDRAAPTVGARYICICGVHGVVECQRDPELRAIHNQAAMVTPDGMPLVWLGKAAGHRHMTRVYGPDLVLELCALSERRGYRHFFYGGGAGVAELLARKLSERFPGLAVAGTGTPPFRGLTPAERAATIELINGSGADIVWVGLSTPKQERWMADLAPELQASVLIGVGAAFDFNSGLKRQAPRWMQQNGFEWLFRLATEPRRLWRRYLFNNTAFLYLLARGCFRRMSARSY